MLWVKLGTHLTSHPRFLALSAVARDLWVWGMLYSGAHELDGALPMVAVLSSTWGRGGRANAKLAQTLVEAGLWVRTDSGYLILRWSEQGNATKAQLEVDREATRLRVAKHRNGVTNTVSNAIVPTSSSTSLSGSRSREPEQDEIASGTGVAPGAPPAWFATAVEVVAMNTGVSLPVGEAWLRYDGHREGKGLARTQPDAQYWLTGVMVPEVRETQRRAARDADRDAKFDRDKRFAKDGPPKPPTQTKAQATAFAEELAARVAATKTAGGAR